MNTNLVNEINSLPSGRSMNSYLQRQSRKSLTLFEGNNDLSGPAEAIDQQQEWLLMEKRLQHMRDRIEKAVLAVKLSSANAAQFDDDLPQPDPSLVSLVLNNR